MSNRLHSVKSTLSPMLAGDWCILIVSTIVIYHLFQALWAQAPASRLQIRVGNQIYATYDLNQQREIHVHGAIGETRIHIADGKARFAASPCHNQYCVHQGWLDHNGQVAICLPNQVSMELIGEHKPYDSLNY